MASKASGKLPVISFGLTALIALGFVSLPARFGVTGQSGALSTGFTWVSTLAMVLTSVAVFPILNTKNSYSPFFDKVRDQLRNRELYTILVDDRRLPLVEFYLDCRVPVIRDNEKLFQLLNRGAKVGVILHHKKLRATQKELRPYSPSTHYSCKRQTTARVGE